jgi:putative Holliday junction resolvase
MRSLGLDVGDKRTGVAISDPQGILATPLTVLASKDEDAVIDEIVKLVEQYKAERIVVGLPRSLNGELREQASKVTAFTERLRNVIASRSPEGSEEAAKQSHLGRVDIQMWDERLSTKAAERLMRETGGKGNKLRSRAKRRVKAYNSSAKATVDAVAAAFILQGFLDSRRPEQ